MAAAPPKFNLSRLLPPPNNVSRTYGESQVELLCGQHAYNMVLQEEKLVWQPENMATKYVAADGSAAENASGRGTRLNMAVICRDWSGIRRYRQAYEEIRQLYPEGTPAAEIESHVRMQLEDPGAYEQEEDDLCTGSGNFPAEMLEDMSWSELKLTIASLSLAELPQYLNVPGCLGAVVNYFDPHIRNHYCAVIKYPDSPYPDRPYAIGESLKNPPIAYYSLDGLMRALRRLGGGRGPVHITCILSQLPDAVQTVASTRMVAMGEEWREAYDAPQGADAAEHAAAAAALRAAQREKPASARASGANGSGRPAANGSSGRPAASANANTTAKTTGGRKSRKRTRRQNR